MWTEQPDGDYVESRQRGTRAWSRVQLGNVPTHKTIYPDDCENTLQLFLDLVIHKLTPGIAPFFSFPLSLFL